ncbi:hypothetical protein VTJ83DRAFT_2486 [Remersonia thermophila]|uniref:Uncharacterized protein n=1 Tax=Remersonia thermophila TaxID=72144 RepID=A0ABR4DL54_9PEZI
MPLSPRASLAARLAARPVRAGAMQHAVVRLPLLACPQHIQAQEQHPRPQQRRSYASRSHTVVLLNASREREALKNLDLPFQASDVPSEDVWKSFKKTHGGRLGGLSPQRCRSIALTYCEVVAQKSKHWEKLEKDHQIDAHSLHWTALPLRYHRTSAAAVSLGGHMLNTASYLGFAPSTLTAVNELTRMGKAALDTPRARAYLDRFNLLVHSSKDPDVLTLKGSLLLLQQQPTAALAYFDKAVEAARSLTPDEPAQRSAPGSGSGGPDKPVITVRKPRWTFEASCHFGRGIALVNLSRAQEAYRAFHVAAWELNHVHSLYLVAQMLNPEAPPPVPQMRESALLAAAQAGHWPAARYLSELLSRRAEDPGVPADQRASAREMAEEWALVAPPEKSSQKESQDPGWIRLVPVGEVGEKKPPKPRKSKR